MAYDIKDIPQDAKWSLLGDFALSQTGDEGMTVFKAVFNHPEDGRRHTCFFEPREILDRLNK